MVTFEVGVAKCELDLVLAEDEVRLRGEGEGVW